MPILTISVRKTMLLEVRRKQRSLARPPGNISHEWLVHEIALLLLLDGLLYIMPVSCNNPVVEEMIHSLECSDTDGRKLPKQNQSRPFLTKVVDLSLFTVHRFPLGVWLGHTATEVVYRDVTEFRGLGLFCQLVVSKRPFVSLAPFGNKSEVSVRE